METIRANEHTVRTFWKEYLDDELRGKPIDIYYDPSIRKSKGSKFPDFYILNKQTNHKFIVETKLGFDDYDDAIIDGYEKMKLTEADASIAVAFPEELRDVLLTKARGLLPSLKGFKAQIRFNQDKYKLEKFRQNLKSNANYHELNDFVISNITLDLSSQVEKQPELSEIIEILRDNVDGLYQEFQSIPEKDVTAILGGKSLFENILGLGSEDILQKKEDLVKIISFLLVSQLLFYYKIQFYFPSFDEITPYNISNISDIINRFQRVANEKDWRPVFDYNILGYYAGQPNEDLIFKRIRAIILDINQIITKEFQDETLGILFHQLIPTEIRKIVAAYYTTIPTAYFLASMAIDSEKCKVIDLACGSGNLLTASYQRKMDLHSEKGHPFLAADHQRFVENEIFGIDIMPFATMLTTINLSLQAPTSYTNKIRIGTEDSTQLKPGDTILPTIQAVKKFVEKSRKITEFMDLPPEIGTGKSNKVKRGAVAMVGTVAEPITLIKYDLVIMNPPFTKSGNMSKIKFKTIKQTKKSEKEVEITYKDLLVERLYEYKDLINKNMGLFAYFILIAHKFLEDDGKIAFVLPSSFLRVVSCEGVRNFLVDNYNIDYIISRVDQPNFSENTALREILLIASKKNANNPPTPCKYLQLSSLPEEKDQIKSLVNRIKDNHIDEDVDVLEFSQEHMKKIVSNWFIPMATTNRFLKDFYKTMEDNPHLVDYTTIVPRDNIIRGLDSTNKKEIYKYSIVDPIHSTGRDIWEFVEANNSEIIAKTVKKEEFISIPSLSVMRGLRTTAGAQTMEIDSLNDYVVVSEFKKIREFISLGFNKAISEVKFDEIDDWKKKTEDRSSNLFHNRRFDITGPGTNHLGYYSVHKRTPTGLTWVFLDIPERLAKLVTLWNNSTIHMLQIYLNRKETAGGYMAVDSYWFKILKIPNFNDLDEKSLQNGLDLYDKCNNVEFPSILEQFTQKFPSRKEIDSYFLDIIFPNQSNAELGENLRTEMRNDLVGIAALMGREEEDDDEVDDEE